MTCFQTFISLKFSIIPIVKAGKTPAIAWKEFIKRRPSDDEIQNWFGGQSPDDGGLNIGVVTGKVSDLIVLDVDGSAGEESLKLLGVLPETATVHTGKGRHFYFRHPGGEVRNFAGKLPGLDLRGDGGYVVAPPSIHENGNSYLWERHPGEVGIAEAPQCLLDLINGKANVGSDTEDTAGKPSRQPRNVRMSQSAKRDIDRLIGELVQANEGTRNDTLNRVAFQFAQYCASGEIDQEWARNKLFEIGGSIGLPDEECISTIDSAFAEGLTKPKQSAEPVLSILDMAPEIMDRPIRLIDGQAFGATWVPVGLDDARQAKPDYARVILGGEGEAYSDRNVGGTSPIENLSFAVDLPHKPMSEKLLSPSGLRRWIEGDLRDPASVFEKVSKGVDAFVSFEHSLSDQRGMCELTASWIIGTYMLDAFDVFGYLWPTGERGSGKTQLLNTVSALAFLGRTITSGSSFAAIRDEADYGATIAFDDCENVRDMENNKRELLLAGNMRGTVISLKEQIGDGEWQTRYINNFAPRLFSSIGLPDEVLGSRTISIPLISSTDKAKTRRNPSAKAGWPVDPRELVDDLWLTAIAHLPEIALCDQEASDKSDLHARGHDIWRVPLAIAWWLQSRHGVEGVFERVTEISVAYQTLKQEVQGLDAVTILLQVLDLMLEETGEQAASLETRLIAERIHQLADSVDQVEADVQAMNASRVGILMGRLGFTKSKSHGQKRAWMVDQQAVNRIAKSRSVELLSTEAREQLPTTVPFDFGVPKEEATVFAEAD